MSHKDRKKVRAKESAPGPVKNGPAGKGASPLKAVQTKSIPTIVQLYKALPHGAKRQTDQDGNASADRKSGD